MKPSFLPKPDPLIPATPATAGENRLAIQLEKGGRLTIAQCNAAYVAADRLAMIADMRSIIRRCGLKP